MIGKTISHYKILEKLGEGGMGVVYRAQDTKLNREVALKFLPPYLASEAGQKERFFNEAQAASALNHPNVTTIHEIDTHYDQIFIAMELVEGKTLKQLVKEDTLPIKKVLEIAIQVCDGLTAAAEKGIVHRDIKSDNIILTPKMQVKIMDFGLAKFKGAGKLTQTGSTVGTAAYMSPEQASGEEVDHRADIFSFGVVLYELLTSHLPFRGEHPSGYIYSILNEEPEPVARFNDKATPELQRIVSKALAKDREERYQHIADLAADLRHERKNLEYAKSSTLPKAEAVHQPKNKILKVLVPASAAALIAVYLLISKFIGPDSKESDSGRKMLAVLPFENLGAPEEEYFADGITEEIITSLAKVSGLGVISRTSTIKYKKTDKSLKQIGAELGANYILEGSISWDKSGGVGRVRINPQLIRVKDDTHLWAETYDRVFEQIFALRSDIAEKVTQALDVTLLEPEQKSLQVKPTENLEAYDFYLRGNDQLNRTTPGTAGAEKYFRIALQMYQKAVELDSGFALAYSQLSIANTELYWHYDRKEEYLKDAQAAVEKAFKLVPGLPEAHIALGTYYYHEWEYEKALEEFAIAQQSLPNNPDLMAEIGYVQRRQGKWDLALASHKKAAELDPGRSDIPYTLGQTYHLLRRYSEAASYYNRAILLDPGGNAPYGRLVELYVRQDGNTEKARKVLIQLTGKVDAAELNDRWVWLDVIEGNYPQALSRLNGPEAYNNDSAGYYLAKAQVYGLMGRAGLKRACYDSVRVLLEKALELQPENEVLHSQLGIAYAGSGRKSEAIREGKKGVELQPINKYALGGADRLADLARIYVMVGEYDAALKEMEYLLSIPSNLSISLLRVDPAWAPLRNNPRFKKLVNLTP